MSELIRHIFRGASTIMGRDVSSTIQTGARYFDYTGKGTTGVARDLAAISGDLREAVREEKKLLKSGK